MPRAPSAKKRKVTDAVDASEVLASKHEVTTEDKPPLPQPLPELPQITYIKKCKLSLSPPSHHPNPLSSHEGDLLLSPPCHQPDPLSSQDDLSMSSTSYQPDQPDPLSSIEDDLSMSPSSHQCDQPDPVSSHEYNSSLSPLNQQPDQPDSLSSLSSPAVYEDVMRCLQQSTYGTVNNNENQFVWFKSFLEKQGERMEQLIGLQKKMLEETREKNKLLRRLTESLLERGSSK